MPGYAKFMKDLVTKKRNVTFETIKVTYQYSAIISQIGVKKMEDPGAFTIPCAIGLTSFVKALCDLVASINLMPYVVYKKLGLGKPKPTSMKLFMADRTLKRSLVDAKIPIILGRPFLAVGRAICDVEAEELKLRLIYEEVVFHIQKSMKHPHDYGVISVIDMVNEVVDEDMQEICMDEAFMRLYSVRRMKQWMVTLKP
uniref:Uncharacterized protein n=1 Tax=Nicotiana tabacum TaxID=4097 RepID=A0A1S3XPQ8_TOBAC|nr:PREDICTED: uncharacterized protein LOC107767428 [Nicotiana tabacum]